MYSTVIGKLISNVKDFYREINPATLTGAIDVVVIEQPNGSFTCSPFHVRFGKLGVLRSKEKLVDIEINGEPLDIHMKLGESGEAFFVEEVSEEELASGKTVPSYMVCSPIVEGHFLSSYSSDITELRKPLRDLENAQFVPCTDFDKHYLSQNRENFDKSETAISLKKEALNLSSSAPIPYSSGKHYIKNYPYEDPRCELGHISDRLVGEDYTEEIRLIKNIRLPKKNLEKYSHSLERNSRHRKKGMLNNKSAPKFVTNIGGHFLQPKNSASAEAMWPENIKSDADQIFVLDDIQLGDAESKELSASFGTIESHSYKTCANVLDNGAEPFSMQQTSTTIDFQLSSDLDVDSSFNQSHSSSSSPFQSETDIQMKDKTSTIMFEIDDGCNNSVNDHVQRSWRWGELPSPIILTPESQKSSESNDLPTHQGFEMEDQPKQDPFKQESKLVNWGESKESEKDMSLLQSPFFEDKESSHCYMQELLKMCMGDVTMSLCGGLNQYSVPSEKSFCQHQVTYEGLNKNPDLLENPDLVVRFCGKYLSWKAAAPQIISVLLFHKHLPQSTIDLLTATHIPLALPASKEIEPVSESSRSYSWFSWRRKLDYNTMQERESCNTLHERLNAKPTEVPTLSPTSLPQPVYNQGPSNNIQIITPHGKEGYSASESSLDSNMGFVQGINVPIGHNNHHFISKQYRKTLRLSSEQIASLNLQDGPNDVTFSVTTAYQGTTRCQCHIYKWHFADKIVISDIDGTITKSDVLGHLFAIVGKDWAQIGVAQLFTKIKNNGYKLLYLSARAIGQAHLTREYLRSIRQNDLTLPDGPLLLSPTSLINAIHREVIEKKPEEFKIPCLKDIKALFPNDINPFYAGYGNKGSDVFAYREVGIPIFRIFTINSRGELKHELTNTFQSSYSGQSCIVNDLFPPLADYDM